MDGTVKNNMISVAAPAKLNLYLHVTGKRHDGYHLIDSLAAFAAEHDIIRVELASDLRLTNTGPFGHDLATDDDNLVMRAARRLRDMTGLSVGAHIHLFKRLPIASGIGGGSADAAATIKALVRLWELHPGEHDLSGLALGLGADVPVCLYGRAAFMGGIGEVLEPVGRLPEMPLVLVNPGIDVPTPSVFRARRGEFSFPAPFQQEPQTGRDLIAALTDGRGNDLMAPAIALAPAIGDVLAHLDAAQGCQFSRMSGSGATCFGFFETTAAATRAAARIGADRPDWWVVATRLLYDVCTLAPQQPTWMKDG